MPQEKLMIVPVTLQRENITSPSPAPALTHSSSSCTIKTANAEVTFYNGVEEHLIQTVMRELKHW
ncbi:hypothetical protein [Schinkia azotoformans]|uniref:hypothetical protein n=1 Tax=Schinkia azotoformans TaxID=1454 RepID=UPI002DB65200|nr:hypothetical protein [Schinkia azotoformans]MEC1718416.1 hypothetical protein [Schinkia azotoformans]MEC1759521.1 hypothetical protein [Schinkia azotoformans]